MQPGERIDRYVVEAELGSGGFGKVYRARHTVIDRPVALKILHPERAGDARLLSRFLQEARASAAVGSPHIVQVTDAGFAGEGQAFLAMELLEGEDLASRIERGGPLPPAEAVGVTRQILEGLGAAHARGIVHRDLKPPNVFLARQPDGTTVAKILDFGISKMIQPGRLDKLTQTGMVMGTPHYMAPEQFRGAAEVDARADLYSCAVILFEMLSGRMPYDAQTYEELILKVFSEPPVPIRSVAPHVPPALESILERGLAREADARWQSAEELSAALGSVEAGAAWDGPSHASAAVPATRITPAHTPAPARTPTPAAVASSVRPAEPGRGGGGWLLLGLLALLGVGLTAVAVVVVLALGGGDDPGGGPPVTMGPMAGGPGEAPGPAAPADPPKPTAPTPPAAEPPVGDADQGPRPTATAPAPADPADDDAPAGDAPRGGEGPAGGGREERPAPSGGAIRAHVEILGDGIPHDDATAVVDRALPRMRRCREPGVTHRVRAQMLVGIGGRIGIAQPDPNSDHGDTGTAQCVAQAIRASGPVHNTEMGGIFYANVTLPPP